MRTRKRRFEDLKRVNITITHEDHQWLSLVALAKETSVSFEIAEIIDFAKKRKFADKELSKMRNKI